MEAPSQPTSTTSPLSAAFIPYWNLCKLIVNLKKRHQSRWHSRCWLFPWGIPCSVTVKLLRNSHRVTRELLAHTQLPQWPRLWKKHVMIMKCCLSELIFIRKVISEKINDAHSTNTKPSAFQTLLPYHKRYRRNQNERDSELNNDTFRLSVHENIVWTIQKIFWLVLLLLNHTAHTISFF